MASPEVLLRLVQSVPSPKAEPIKLWLAKVGYERMQEMADPSQALEHCMERVALRTRVLTTLREVATLPETAGTHLT